MIDRLLVFGDSITWGAADEEFLGWANRLRKYVQSANQDVAVYNCGVKGDTTRNLLNRFEVEVNARKSRNNDELILFAIGINDSRTVNGKTQTDLSEYKENLQKLIDISKSITNNIVFIGLTNVVDSRSSWKDDRGLLVYTSERVKEYDDAIMNITKNNKLPYLEMFNVLDTENLPEDGLHPDAEGHKKMFNKISDFLKTYLEIV